MSRRQFLGSAAVTGAGLLAARYPTARAAETSPQGPTSALTTSFAVTRDGTRLFYRDWGTSTISGTGEPVMFVSSWALSSDMWGPQMSHFNDRGLRCIAYDRRGHGRSGDPGRGYDYDTLADDLAVLMDGLDLRGATLVGHSMGCGEIVRYLTRHGSHRVARIVLLAPTTPLVVRTPDNPDGVDPAILERVRGLWRKDFPKWLADNARPFVVPETSPEMLRWLADLMLRCSMRALIECNRAVTATDFRGELPAVAVPTLIIHGDADVSAPIELTGRKTARFIPGSQFRLYEGAPHGLFVTHADRVNADILEFMQT
jgi:non-heme chloroperoxidase